MRKNHLRGIAASAAVLLFLFAATEAGAAGAMRTFVSGAGNDSNNCSRALPCRSFATALGQTNAGGEIVVLDSAGYGTLTITQSVTISNPNGVEAAITAGSGQTAITINTSAAATVVLRGLTIDGGGVGQTGIDVPASVPDVPFTNELTIDIEDCIVRNFTGNGIAFHPTSAGFAGVDVTVANSEAINNGGTGLIFNSTNAILSAAIDRTLLSGNSGGGLFVAGGSDNSVFMDESHADNNPNTSGINLAGSAELTMNNSTAWGNEIVFLSNQSVLTLTNRNHVAAIEASNGITPNAVDTDGTNIIELLGSGVTLSTPSFIHPQ